LTNQGNPAKARKLKVMMGARVLITAKVNNLPPDRS
jgi:hypothetical protein